MAPWSSLSQKMFEIAGEVKCAFTQSAGSSVFLPGSLVFNNLGSSYNCSIVCANRKPKTVKLSGQIKSLHSRDSQLNIVLLNGTIYLKGADELQLYKCIQLLDQIRAGKRLDKQEYISAVSSPNKENSGYHENSSNVSAVHVNEQHSVGGPNAVNKRATPEKKSWTPFKNQQYKSCLTTPLTEKRKTSGSPVNMNTTPTKRQKPQLQEKKHTPVREAQSFYGANNSYNRGFSTPGRNVQKRILPSPVPRPSARSLSAFGNFSFKRRNEIPKNRSGQVLKGFSNLGNTCYMNAILQSLLGMAPFSQDLSNKKLLSEVHPSCLYRCLYNLLLKKSSSDSSDVRSCLKSIKAAISEAATRFSGYSQQDAHEFLCQVLDQLKDDTRKPIRDENTNGIVQVEDELSPVLRNFECSVLHTITCVECNTTITKEEHHHDFSLDIPNSDQQSKKLSVLNLLHSYFEPEELDYTCAKCEGTKATVFHQFIKLPRILVVHLKRYRYDYIEGREDKIEDKIHLNRHVTVGKLCTDFVTPPLSLVNKETKIQSTQMDKGTGHLDCNGNIVLSSEPPVDITNMSEEQQLEWAMRESALTSDGAVSLSHSHDSGFGESSPSNQDLFKASDYVNDEEMMEVDIPGESDTIHMDSDSGNSSSDFFIMRESFGQGSEIRDQSITVSDDSEYETTPKVSSTRQSMEESMSAAPICSTPNLTTTGLAKTATTSKKSAWLHEYSSDSSDNEKDSLKQFYLNRSAKKRANTSAGPDTKRFCSDAREGLLSSQEESVKDREYTVIKSDDDAEAVFNDQLQMALAASLDDNKMLDTEEREVKEALELSMKDLQHTPPSTNTSNIQVPQESRKSSKTVSKADIQPFRLVSVVSHIGSSSNSGHYVSDVFDCKKQQWARYDDSYVKKIEEHEACYQRQESGYILFYMYKDCVDHLSKDSCSV